MGSAVGGFVNIGRSDEEDVQLTNNPGADVSTAVGNALAGGISVALAENGKVRLMVPMVYPAAAWNCCCGCWQGTSSVFSAWVPAWSTAGR
jgi:hypothetical protein